MLTTTAPGIHPEYKRISKWLFFGRLELDDSDIFQSANSKILSVSLCIVSSY